MIAPQDRNAVYEQFRKQLNQRPTVDLEGEHIVFSDGTPTGFRYHRGRVEKRDPLLELFERPWFTKAHADAAVPFVRWALDQNEEEERLEIDEKLGYGSGHDAA
jgi:hypothetical protein